MSETKYVFCLQTNSSVGGIPMGDEGEIMEVSEWFDNDGKEYEILGDVWDYDDDDILRFDGEEGCRGNEYLDIIRVLKQFAKDFNTEWIGEFYLFDDYDKHVFRAPSFEMEDFVDE